MGTPPGLRPGAAQPQAMAQDAGRIRERSEDAKSGRAASERARPSDARAVDLREDGSGSASESGRRASGLCGAWVAAARADAERFVARGWRRDDDRSTPLRTRKDRTPAWRKSDSGASAGGKFDVSALAAKSCDAAERVLQKMAAPAMRKRDSSGSDTRQALAASRSRLPPPAHPLPAQAPALSPASASRRRVRCPRRLRVPRGRPRRLRLAALGLRPRGRRRSHAVSHASLRPLPLRPRPLRRVRPRRRRPRRPPSLRRPGSRRSSIPWRPSPGRRVRSKPDRIALVREPRPTGDRGNDTTKASDAPAVDQSRPGEPSRGPQGMRDDGGARATSICRKLG